MTLYDITTGTGTSNTTAETPPAETWLRGADGLPQPHAWPPFIHWRELVPGQAESLIGLILWALVAIVSIFGVVFGVQVVLFQPFSGAKAVTFMERDILWTIALTLCLVLLRSYWIVARGYGESYSRLQRLTLAAANLEETIKTMGSESSVAAIEIEGYVGERRQWMAEIERERFQISTLSDVLGNLSEGFPRFEIDCATRRNDLGGKWFLQMHVIPESLKRYDNSISLKENNRVLVLNSMNYEPLGLFRIVRRSGGVVLAAPFAENAIRSREWWEEVKRMGSRHGRFDSPAMAILIDPGELS